LLTVFAAGETEHRIHELSGYVQCFRT
jgi:hypothetical protein